MSLAEIRKKIDRLDIEILEKLNDRLALALETKTFKPEVSDRGREDRVIERVKAHAQKLQPIDSDFVEKVFTELIREGRRLQNEEER